MPAAFRTRSACFSCPALIPGADAPPPSSGGARLNGSGSHPAAVDDERPPEVPERIAPRVDQAGERPDRPDDPGGHGVNLVDDRRAGNRGDVRLSAEQPPEPRCNREPIVVAAAEEIDEYGRHDPGENNDQQEDEREIVDGVSCRPHPGDEKPPRGKDDDTAENQYRSHCSGGGREPAVDVLGNSDRLRPPFGDENADDMPHDGGKGAVVEDRTAPLEEAAFLQLRRSARPAELVVPPTPDMADHENAECQVGEADPEKDLPSARVCHSEPPYSRVTTGAGEERLPGAGVKPRYSGGANGSTPTSSCGGPSRRSRSTRTRSGRFNRGSNTVTASMSSTYGLSMCCNAPRSTSSSARCAARSDLPFGERSANSSTIGR